MPNKHNRSKLLIPAYAGELNDEELAYIKSQLLADRQLRARWGFKRGTGRLSEKRIREVAMDGLQEAHFREKKPPL